MLLYYNHTMQTISQQNFTERVLEKIRVMPLPENEHVFSLHADEEKDHWRLGGVVGPFAHTIQDGEPFPTLCVLPLSELKFPTKEDALAFAKAVHDILEERGKGPDGPTFHLLERDLDSGM